MSKVVTVKGVTIGKGLPKICVSMVEKTTEKLIEEANFLKELDIDIVEWRVDFFEHVRNIDKVIEMLRVIRTIIAFKPIIFTFRSHKEGGQVEVSKKYYAALNKTIVNSRLVDVIDVELFSDEKDIKELVELAHVNCTAVIISNHDFDKTPPKEEILSRLRREDELGGDILKIAVMPNCTADVITLLDATRNIKEKYTKCPVITMAMGGRGVITRLSGEIFGSDMTFGCTTKASAPGQISVLDLRRIIELLHNQL